MLLLKELMLPNFQKAHYLLKSTWVNLTQSLSFITTYYSRNELIWSDGFLIDFLQKKTADMWIRKFVIHTGFLFSERLAFEAVVRLYLDNIIWPSHNLSTFETSNVSEMLLNMLYLYFLLFLFSFIAYLYLLI
jgi:hypothetical protein